MVTAAATGLLGRKLERSAAVQCRRCSASLSGCVVARALDRIVSEHIPAQQVSGSGSDALTAMLGQEGRTLTPQKGQG
jgi:hypothetical protein